MEAQLFFTGLVLFICLVHVTTTVGKMLRTFFDHSSAKKSSPSHNRPRDDWYVFFHCADLTGNIDQQRWKVIKNQNISVDPISTTSKKGSRPRVYA